MTTFSFYENNTHLLTISKPTEREARERFVEILNKFDSPVSVADVRVKKIYQEFDTQVSELP